MKLVTPALRMRSTDDQFDDTIAICSVYRKLFLTLWEPHSAGDRRFNLRLITDGALFGRIVIRIGVSSFRGDQDKSRVIVYARLLIHEAVTIERAPMHELWPRTNANVNNIYTET